MTPYRETEPSPWCAPEESPNYHHEVFKRELMLAELECRRSGAKTIFIVPRYANHVVNALKGYRLERLDGAQPGWYSIKKEWWRT